MLVARGNRLAFVIAVLLCAASPAFALTLSNLGVTDSSTSFFDNAGPTGSVAQSSTSIGASGPTGFDLRYAAVVGADTGGAGGGSFTQTFTGSFSVSFEVTEVAGWSWVVNVDVVRAGALSIVTDGNGTANVTLDALSVSHAGAGSLVGSLDLAAVGTLSNGSAPSLGQDRDQAFSQSGSAVISGFGTGAAQLVTLVFTFTASASTVDPAGGLVQGDEAALRMGLDSGLGAFTADDYPGAGGRTLATDGLYVFAAVPEPAAEVLLALGLLGLGWFDRKRPRR